MLMLSAGLDPVHILWEYPPAWASRWTQVQEKVSDTQEPKASITHKLQGLKPCPKS